MTTFSAGINKSNSTHFILLCFSHVSTGAASEDDVDAIREILEDGRDYLHKWRSENLEIFPSCAHDMPDPEALSLNNCDSSAFTIDT